VETADGAGEWGAPRTRRGDERIRVSSVLAIDCRSVADRFPSVPTTVYSALMGARDVEVFTRTSQECAAYGFLLIRVVTRGGATHPIATKITKDEKRFLELAARPPSAPLHGAVRTLCCKQLQAFSPKTGKCRNCAAGNCMRGGTPHRPNDSKRGSFGLSMDLTCRISATVGAHGQPDVGRESRVGTTTFLRHTFKRERCIFLQFLS
jgi:hypothetical protein